ncbi:MAG: efflux RND transporter periplasmic adaptor subunit [bacterium]
MLQSIKKHKIVFLIILLLAAGGCYYGYNKYKIGNAKPRYIASAVKKGTLIVSVSSSGQISASNQVDISSKVSGYIAKIAVAAGQEVKAGDLIAQIDAKNAYKAVRDAKLNLESAYLSMDKLKQPADANSILAAKNAVASAQNSLDKLKMSQPIDYQNALAASQTAKNNSEKSYEDALTAISNSFLNLPNIMSAMNDILYSDQISQSDNSLGRGQINTDVLYNTTYETDQFKIKSYQAIAEKDYSSAKLAYDANYANFKKVSVYSGHAEIENLLSETLAAVKAMAQAVKSENNYFAVWSDARSLRNMSIFTQISTYKTNLSTYSGQINSSLSSLSSAQSAIQNYKDAIVSANNNLKSLIQNQPFDLASDEANLEERKLSLADLEAGAEPMDIRSQEISLQQKKEALYDAQTVLADYTVKAPFDGVIAAVNVKEGDSSSGVIATIITKQSIAEISLNEVDAAKIKTGDKAMIAFDAIDGLNISGRVAGIDEIGTVSQGVVTYNVKIVFDTQDDRVKSGMSANAVIIIDSKVDVLLAPSSAVKNGRSDYVEILDADGQPQRKPVVIGASDDTMTEIISGLKEGDKIIIQTITATAPSASANQPSAAGLRIPGMTGGGNFRRE